MENYGFGSLLWQISAYNDCNYILARHHQLCISNRKYINHI